MNIQVHNFGSLVYAQIDNLYQEQEIFAIKKELAYLEIIKEPANQTSSAIKDNISLKKGSGVFLDNLYTDRKFSVLLTLNRKIFNKGVSSFLSTQNCFFDHLAHSNFDTTLINFYGPNDEYKAHRDSSALTALTFFKLGDFTGGELVFDEYDVSIEPEEGRTIVFPGCVLHSARQTISDPGNFRVTMAQFINYCQ